MRLLSIHPETWIFLMIYSDSLLYCLEHMVEKRYFCSKVPRKKRLIVFNAFVQTTYFTAKSQLVY